VSEWPEGHRQRQSRGQPPSAGRPAPGSPPPVYPRGGQAPAPRPARRKRPRKRNVILLVLAAILVIGVISSALGSGSGKSSKSATAAVLSARSAKASAGASSQARAIVKAEDACDNRPSASGDIYVRRIKPGGSSRAQQLGGEWRWDHATNKCVTPAQLMTATAPRGAGNCTQVGYVSDNPGYDVNAAVAAPLMHVVAQAGPACKAAPSPAPVQTTPAPVQTTPAPVQTTPAAAVPPPASPTPAGCYPLSDEGTCYEPGEYCRDDDQGMSGVAGDGEAITCEDNDGWRWEPA
jgi:hypothetical protein